MEIDDMNYVFSNPYSCDNCGDVFNKNDLHKHEDTKYCCKNCMEYEL